MKILIVASGFTGATMPLANHLCQKGHTVKCFYVVERKFKSIESLDFEHSIPMTWGKPVLVSKSNNIYNYLDKGVDIAILPKWKLKHRMEKAGVGLIFPLLNWFLVKKYIQCIIAEKPDIVNLIVHSEVDVQIAKALKIANIPFSVTYHEVLKGLVDKKVLKDEVISTLQLGTPIVLHSSKTTDDLLDASADKKIKDRVNIINFGAFESYLSYREGSTLANLPAKYLLYLGHVHPYKGLKYLYDAVQILGNELNGVKIVVAGGGYDPAIDSMKKNSHFVVFNHFVDNAELVGLIRNCKAIICPYVAASQSGLVQTGMVFNKPVIATKVGAFTEVIKDKENGLLCEPANAQSLAEAIEIFLSGKYEFHASAVPQNLNWDVIADKYIALYNTL